MQQVALANPLVNTSYHFGLIVKGNRGCGRCGVKNNSHVVVLFLALSSANILKDFDVLPNFVIKHDDCKSSLCHIIGLKSHFVWASRCERAVVHSIAGFGCRVVERFKP